jgi:hypothetical protein
MNASSKLDVIVAQPRVKKTFIALPMLALIVLVTSFQYLPILDYPDWLYQGFLLKEVWLHTELGKSFMMTPYLPPNSLVTMLIALLSMLMPVMLAGKAVLALSLVSMYAGLYAFLRSVSPCKMGWCGLVAFLLTPGYFLFQGNLGYLLGMGIALAAPGVLAGPEGWKRSMLLTTMLVLAYLAHVIALAFLLLFLLIHWLENRQFSTLKPLLVPILVIVLLLAHYGLASRSYVRPHFAYDFRGKGIAGLAIEQFSMFVGPLKLFRGFNGISQANAFREGLNMVTVAASFCVMIGGIGIGLFRRKSIAWLAVFLGGLVLALPSHFGGMYRPAERLVPVVMAISLALAWEFAKKARPVMGWSLGLVVVAMFAYHLRCATIFNRVIERPGWEAAAATPQTKGWHFPFARFQFYQAIDRRQPAQGVYATGMILPRMSLPAVSPEAGK